MAAIGAREERKRGAAERRQIALQTITRAQREMRSVWSQRAHRQSMCTVVVPLVMNAAGTLGLWWTWPVLLGCAYGFSPAWRWMWVVAVEEAVIGSVWLSVGANAVRTWPGSLPLVGAYWAGFPALLAVVGWWSHRSLNE